MEPVLGCHRSAQRNRRRAVRIHADLQNGQLDFVSIGGLKRQRQARLKRLGVLADFGAVIQRLRSGPKIGFQFCLIILALDRGL